MTHLGILLVCDHYPTVSTDPKNLDAQLRGWFADIGHEVTELSVFECYRGKFPKTVGDCDTWIVSGSPLGCEPTGLDVRGLILEFLRGVAASCRPVFALHHGEHVLHAALACPSSLEPETAKTVRAIRNPFRSFWQRDVLFRYDATRRMVVPARSQAILKLAA